MIVTFFSAVVSGAGVSGAGVSSSPEPGAGVSSSFPPGAAPPASTFTEAFSPSNVTVTVEPSASTVTVAFEPPLEASPSRLYSPLSQAPFVAILNSYVPFATFSNTFVNVPSSLSVIWFSAGSQATPVSPISPATWYVSNAKAEKHIAVAIAAVATAVVILFNSFLIF